MHTIEFDDKLSKLIAAGFDKTIFSASFSDFVAMAGSELFNQIMDRISHWETPLYFGEAEYLLLQPLASICTANTPHLTQEVYARAGAYAILDEILTLSSTRDLASSLSRDVIINNPVLKQLIAAGVFTEGLDPDTQTDDDALRNITFTDDSGTTVTINKGAKDVMSIIMKALSGIPITSHGTSSTDVISILNGIYSLGTLSEAQDTIGSLYGTLQTSLKMGKRYPMNESERTAYFNNLVLPITNWIANQQNRIAQALSTQGPDTAFDMWADFLIVVRWFNFYLDCVERYDEVFPAQLVQSQSQAQVMALGRSANRMKGIFLKLTQSSMTTALSWSFSMWNSMYDFFLHFLPDTSNVKDLKILMDELTTDYSAVRDPWAHSIVEATIQRMKTLSGCDVLLEESMTAVARLPKALHDIVQTETRVMSHAIPTGIDALSYLSSMTKSYKMGSDSRLVVLTILSNIATSFNASVSCMMQSNQFITRDSQLPIREQMIDDATFEYRYPAQPLGLLPVKADFTRKDESIRTYTPWVIEDDSIRWINLKKINTMQRVKDIQDDMVAHSPSTIYWPSLPEIKVGEPYLTELAKQPVLATYTQNVTTDMLPLSWATWFRTLATHATGIKPEEYLAIAATALAQDYARNRGPIGTCFAGIGAIAMWMDGSTKMKIVEPNIPWVYGVPFDVMVRANHVEERVDRNHQPSLLWAVGADDNLLSSSEKTLWYTDAYALDGTKVHFCFVMWTVAPALTDLMIPEPESVNWTLFQLVKGSYFLVPIRKSFADGSAIVSMNNMGRDLWEDENITYDNNTGQLHISSSCPEIWQTVKGLCPVVLTLPHITWDMATSARDEMTVNSDFLKNAFSYINIPVKYKFNDYDRSISFVAMYVNPPVLIEVADFKKETESDHVYPTQLAHVSGERPNLRTDDGKAAPMGQDNGAVPNPSLSTAPGISTKDAATLANPLYKVEAAKTPADKASLSPSPTGKGVVGHAATHAGMEFTPNNPIQNSQINPDDYAADESDPLAGQPHAPEGITSASTDADNSAPDAKEMIRESAKGKGGKLPDEVKKKRKKNDMHMKEGDMSDDGEADANA